LDCEVAAEKADSHRKETKETAAKLGSTIADRDEFILKTFSLTPHFLAVHLPYDWKKRGLVDDITRQLGALNVTNAAREMTINWKGYRYMVSSASNRAGISALEARLRESPLPMIPKSRVSAIEPKLRSGDIISIVSNDGGAFGTSHVGLALRTRDGVLHFMHASAPRNYGKVVIDSRLSDYLTRYGSHAGIMVTRPLK
jgi:hypothetical protein